MRRDRCADLLAWLFWSAVLCPLSWLCRWPAGVHRAVLETELALIFNSADAATDPRWTRRALYAVRLRAQRASGSTHP